MSKIKVICTSTGCIEYAPERYHNLGIDIIRIHLYFKGKEYLEGYNLDPEDLYEQMLHVEDIKGAMPHTDMPTREEVCAVYDKAVAEGYDEAIVIAISSGLGGTYNLLRLIASEYKNIKIHVVDAKITCWNEGLLAIRAKEFVDKGMDAETILKEIEWIKARQEYIGFSTRLDYMILNGRLKGAKAFMGKVMSICPVLHFSHDGFLCPLSSAVGATAALKKACIEVKGKIGDRDPKDYVLCHAYSGTSVLEKLKVIEKQFNIVTNHEDVIQSPVSGIQTGPWVGGFIYSPIRRPDEPLE